MSRIESAMTSFAEGFNCSQAVLSAYADQSGLDRELAWKIASGFGGGMGRMADTCGAVTGAFMVLGLKYGAASSDREAKERIYEQIREFARLFRARNGSLLCRDLLGCDINTPEGLSRAKEVCPSFVRAAAEILEDMLAVDPHQYAKSLGYSDEELRGIPEGVMCHGCGNPIELADLTEGETVLDLGSDGGLDAFLAAKRVGLMGKVIGVDKSPEIVAAATANASRGPYANVTFRGVGTGLQTATISGWRRAEG
jgi:C_GCAxxG_C_C family probable redox protein